VAKKKKSVSSRKLLPKPGGKVVLKEIPPGLLDGLPEEDQRAISAIVGVPILLRGYDESRAELKFVEGNGTMHLIYVDPRYVKAVRSKSRKLIKRRK
jgi:hypothetical protein